jgi:hypothetical protein
MVPKTFFVDYLATVPIAESQIEFIPKKGFHVFKKVFGVFLIWLPLFFLFSMYM